MIRYEKLQRNQYDQAVSLALKVFDEFEAPDYSPEGINTFHTLMEDNGFLNEIQCYGAFDQTSRLVGIIATRMNGSHVTLFFVDKDFHKQGIGRKLFETVKEKCSSKTITVNSSPYAVEIYRHLGFRPTGGEEISEGIRFTHMEYKKSNS